MSYVTRLVGLTEMSSRREVRRSLLEMVGEILDETSKEAMKLRGLELAARLTGACDVTATLEPPVARPDMSRFERPLAISLPGALPAQDKPLKPPRPRADH